MLYILCSSYTPNSASSNRALAYYKSIDNMGIDARIVILQPDSKENRINYPFKHIKVDYYWKKRNRNRLLRYISYYKNVIKFVRSLHKGDKVYIYGSISCLYLILRRGVDVYFEVTEHPQVHPIRTRIWGNSLAHTIQDFKELRGLFVISTYLYNFFVDSGIPASKVHIINMMADTSRFENLNKTPSPKYICYCGNGNNKKDHVDDLIKIFKRISERYEDVLLYIIGPTKQAYCDEQDNVLLVEKLKLQDRVRFLGVLPAEEIPQILVNAEVLALTRHDSLQNRAGFPTKLGEYLLSGTPVVSTIVGDIPLYLKDKDDALLVQPGDAVGIEKQIMWVLDNPEEARKIGLRGKDVATKVFNAEIESRKLISVICS